MSNDIYNELHSIVNDILVHHEELDKTILADHGLRRARFYTLRNIYNNPNISITNLSVMTLVDVASTSRMVRSLEKDGLLQRHSDENDRRAYYVNLTEEGKTLFLQANAAMQADLINRFSSINFDELTNIFDVLKSLSDLFSEHLEHQKSQRE